MIKNYGEVDMQFYYGDQNSLRVLDEVEFWKQQEAEHTTVIEQAIPNIDDVVFDQLHTFSDEFTSTEQKAVQLIETVIRSKNQVNHVMQQHIMDFIQHSICESEQFIQFLTNMKRLDVITQNPVAPVILDHIIRESQYFIGIAQVIMYTN